MKDLDFDRRELTVRDGKGGRDRLTLLPQSLVSGLHPLGVRSPADIVYRTQHLVVKPVNYGYPEFVCRETV